MTRVEWTRLEGNDVEAVVAMFVNREHPRSTRITPSSGDGGIDVLDRNVDNSGLDIVYQVKRYTGPLTTGQKNEIEGSLKRLKGPTMDDDDIKKDPRWADLRVQEWHLVTPWDPSPEAELWLQELGKAYGVVPVWDGLVMVDQLAAKYPDIVDYYLHGGRDQVQQAYAQVAALFAVGSSEESLDVPSVSERIQKALGTLDHDPHYQYEHRFGYGTTAQVGGRPGLVFSWTATDAKTGCWTIVDVIARCAASAQERPITVEGVLHLEPGSDAEKAYRDFLTYGAPFTSPPGAYKGKIDAPSGLGGPFEGATISIGSVAEIGDSPHLYLEVLGPDGVVLGGVNIDRVERSQGANGVRAVFDEEHQIFMLEDRYNLESGTGNRRLTLGDIAGKPVTAVEGALTFLSHCHPSNSGRLSVRHTPPELGVPDSNIGFLHDAPAREYIGELARLVRRLAAFQARTSAVVTFPDLDQLSAEQIRDWQFAEGLLQGREAVGTYPDGSAILVELDPGTEVPDGNVVIEMPLTVAVGSQRITLGVMHVVLEDATLVARREIDGRTFHEFQTPDRRVKHRLAPNPAE